GIGRACEVDADCGENRICADEQCRRTCTTDEDCIDRTNTCRSWVDNARDEPVNVCLPPADAGNPDADAGCTSDRQCQTRLDASSARCGLDGRCVIARRDYDGLLIRDRTEVAASGPQSRRGAEIGAVFLAADDGTPTHHARTVADGYRPGAGLGGDSHLDGRSVDLDGSGECVTTPLADHTTRGRGPAGRVRGSERRFPPDRGRRPDHDRRMGPGQLWRQSERQR
ncbi:MAG: hypothetical protein ABEN55_17150, partial [Bradymonadaceae bacterium]